MSWKTIKPNGDIDDDFLDLYYDKFRTISCGTCSKHKCRPVINCLTFGECAVENYDHLKPCYKYKYTHWTAKPDIMSLEKELFEL